MARKGETWGQRNREKSPTMRACGTIYLVTAKRAALGAPVALTLILGGDLAGADAGASTTPLRRSDGIRLMRPAPTGPAAPARWAVCTALL